MVEYSRALKLQQERKNIMQVEQILRANGGIEVSPLELYSDMFHIGEGLIQKNSKGSRDLVANPLIYMKNNASKTGAYRIIFEDELAELLEEAGTYDFAITNGITYFGRKNVQEHASKMFALIFDLDGVGEREAINFFSGVNIKEWKVYPLPNYIVISGHGLHLYYIFDWPLPLYPNIKLQLKNFKYGLTRMIWNGNTSQIKTPQYQGINQGFRLAGGKTKIEGYRSKIFRFNTHPWTLKQLCEYVPKEFHVDEDKLFKESRLSLEEAKRQFPDWHQKRVLEKQPRKTWRCKEDLYKWWYGRIKEEARFGHRYFCIMTLAIYGVKCGVPKEKVEADAFAIQNEMTDLNPLEPFTDADIKSALECYDERYLTFPIKDISKITTISIEKNKRNFQPQSVHLETARAIRDIRLKAKGKKWDENNGRKPKQALVQEWRKNNPDGTKYRCAKETGISKTTVMKWWDSETT